MTSLNILKSPMIKTYKYLLSLCFLILVMTQVHGQEQWELVKEKQGIKVFSRSNDSLLFKEFKATMQIRAEISDFLAVIYDVEGLPQWGHNIIESKMLDKPDPLNQTYYAVAKAPWPYKNRDGVYKNSISWDPNMKALTVAIDMPNDLIEMNEDFVRMDGYGYWKAREISSDQLEITFQMQVDPGGAIKAWVANMFVTDSPYFTMKGLREVIQDKKYQGHSYEFLK